MIRIKLADATLEQLRAFAAIHRGIAIDQRWNPNTLRAKIAETGYTADEIEIPDQMVEAKTIAAPVGKRASGETDDDNRLIRLRINKEKNVPGGMDMVPVSVNGIAIAIPRGEVVKVKAKYARALANAVVREHSTPVGADGRMIPDQGAIDEGVEIDRFPVVFYDELYLNEGEMA